MQNINKIIAAQIESSIHILIALNVFILCCRTLKMFNKTVELTAKHITYFILIATLQCYVLHKKYFNYFGLNLIAILEWYQHQNNFLIY